MAAYHDFTSTRTTPADLGTLRAAVQTATGDVTANVYNVSGALWRGKKAAVWSAADIAAVQSAIDSAASITPQMMQQYVVDAMPLSWKALALALIDQLNVIRAALPVPKPPITPAQALQAIRDKAGTL